MSAGKGIEAGASSHYDNCHDGTNCSNVDKVFRSTWMQKNSYPSSRNMCLTMTGLVEARTAQSGERQFRYQIPAKTRNFSLLHNARTGYGAHTDPYSTGTWGSFPKVRRSDRLTTHPAPPMRLHGLYWEKFALAETSLHVAALYGGGGGGGGSDGGGSSSSDKPTHINFYVDVLRHAGIYAECLLKSFLL
jgi:hypothetical protein